MTVNINSTDRVCQPAGVLFAALTAEENTELYVRLVHCISRIDRLTSYLLASGGHDGALREQLDAWRENNILLADLGVAYASGPTVAS